MFLSRCQCPKNPEEFIGRPCAWKGSRAKQFSHHHHHETFTTNFIITIIYETHCYITTLKKRKTTSLLHFPTLSHNQQHCDTFLSKKKTLSHIVFFSLIQHHVCFMFRSLDWWILVTYQKYIHKIPLLWIFAFTFGISGWFLFMIICNNY